MGTITIFTNKLMACIPKCLQAANNVTNSYDCYLNITKTICSTILILVIIFAVLTLLSQIIRLWITSCTKNAEMKHELALKDKLLEAKKYDEKNFYRKKRANLHEIMAKESNVTVDPETKKKTLIIDETKCNNHIAEIQKIEEQVDKTT